jgi:hypothetical protein
MYFKRLINIVLVFALLISVIGVTTTSAICKYKAGINALCKSPTSCCKNIKESNHCCEVKLELKKLDTDLRQEHVDAAQDLVWFVAAYFYVAFEQVQEEAAAICSDSYSPPPLTRDLSILHQVFRI